MWIAAGKEARHQKVGVYEMVAVFWKACRVVAT